MTKEEFEKLKETVAYFGHWYDVIGEERVSILEKSIEYIVDLEKENIELKEQNEKLLGSCAGATMMYEDLCKAKEHINTLISCLIDWVQEGDKDYCYIADAEQFLRETDIDNAIQKANEGLDLDKIVDEVEQDIKEQKVK